MCDTARAGDARLPPDRPDTVEAEQTGVGSNPQITVGRLRDRENGAGDEAIADLPRRVRVLPGVEGRVERPRW